MFTLENPLSWGIPSCQPPFKGWFDCFYHLSNTLSFSQYAVHMEQTFRINSNQETSLGTYFFLDLGIISVPTIL